MSNFKIRKGTKPQFENRERNGIEFGIASKNAASIRRAANRIVSRSIGLDKCHYLVTQIYKNIQANSGEWGTRNIEKETLDLYIGNIELGSKQRLDTTFLRTIDYEKDDITGVWRIVFAKHNSATDIIEPSGATHYNFAVGMLMQTAEKYGWCCTEYIEPIGAHSMTGAQVNRLEFELPTPTQAIGNTKVFIVAIQFWKLENQNFIAIDGGRQNPVKILAVENQ